LLLAVEVRVLVHTLEEWEAERLLGTVIVCLQLVLLAKVETAPVGSVVVVAIWAVEVV